MHSPTPSGTTQADLYVPLRLPSILVGDAKLGGISTTISAFESLKIRGYDVDTVLVFEDGVYRNFEYLKKYFQDHHDHVEVFSTAGPPEKKEHWNDELLSMWGYYAKAEDSDFTHRLLRHLADKHERRLEALDSMASRASRKIWYPFTQQALVGPKDITVIDSAHGDNFHTLVAEFPTTTAPNTTHRHGLVQPSFDGSASWWTQGLGHAAPRLTLAAAYAAGRYGHVMFAGAVHAPALRLAETLLRELANPRAARVFFSDDGSTGVEVALKMALRAARLRYGGAAAAAAPLEVLGLKGGYHGDTIGAMDCAEPCVYNERE